MCTYGLINGGSIEALDAPHGARRLELSLSEQHQSFNKDFSGSSMGLDDTLDSGGLEKAASSTLLRFFRVHVSQWSVKY